MTATFFSGLWRELVRRRSWRTRRELRVEVAEYTDGFYNTRRRQADLRYCSPAQYEARATRAG